jgi:hypothetical protein
MFDIGFSGDLLLSEYKAQWFGLKKDIQRNQGYIRVGGSKELGFCYYMYVHVITLYISQDLLQELIFFSSSYCLIFLTFFY